MSRPVWKIAPQSVIMWPAPDTKLEPGFSVQAWGWAWGDDGVSGVELSVDGGSTWKPCRLESASGHSWRKFV